MAQDRRQVIPTPTLCLLTRPRGASERVATRLRHELGLTCLISPLLEIAPIAPDRQIPAAAALILTSAAAANRLLALQIPLNTKIFAVGEATAKAVRDQGYAALAGPGDAERLVPWLMSMAPRDRMIHLRGQHSRGNIVQRLCDLGQDADEIVVYQQASIDLTSEAKEALAGENRLILPLFSPRTASILSSYPTPAAETVPVAMSTAVAEQMRWFAPASIKIADAPTLDAMVAAIRNVATQRSVS